MDEGQLMALVVNAPNLIFYVSVARADDGYYSSADYETPSGGAHSAVYKRGIPYPNKLEAIRGAIKKKLEDDWVTNYAGNRGHLEAALKELSKYEYKQLTLF